MVRAYKHCTKSIDVVLMYVAIPLPAAAPRGPRPGSPRLAKTAGLKFISYDIRLGEKYREAKLYVFRGFQIHALHSSEFQIWAQFHFRQY